jgi:hypothetical protein
MHVPRKRICSCPKRSLDHALVVCYSDSFGLFSWVNFPPERRTPCPSKMSGRGVTTSAGGSRLSSSRAPPPPAPYAGSRRGVWRMNTHRRQPWPRCSSPRPCPCPRRANRCCALAWRRRGMSRPVRAVAASGMAARTPLWGHSPGVPRHRGGPAGAGGGEPIASWREAWSSPSPRPRADGCENTRAHAVVARARGDPRAECRVRRPDGRPARPGRSPR